MTIKDRKKLNAISQIIYDKKGFNILVLDVRGLSTMTDYYVIAEGTVDRHVQALCRALKDLASTHDLAFLRVEGERSGDWVVMDSGDIIVHLFTSDMREKYALEELWTKAKIIDTDIIIKN